MIASARQKIQKILICNTYGFRLMRFSFSNFGFKVNKYGVFFLFFGMAPPLTYFSPVLLLCGNQRDYISLFIKRSHECTFKYRAS